MDSLSAYPPQSTFQQLQNDEELARRLQDEWNSSSPSSAPSSSSSQNQIELDEQFARSLQNSQSSSYSLPPFDHPPSKNPTSSSLSTRKRWRQKRLWSFKNFPFRPPTRITSTPSNSSSLPSSSSTPSISSIPHTTSSVSNDIPSVLGSSDHPIDLDNPEHLTPPSSFITAKQLSRLPTPLPPPSSSSLPTGTISTNSFCPYERKVQPEHVTKELHQLLQHNTPSPFDTIDLQLKNEQVQSAGLLVSLLPHQVEGHAWMESMEQSSKRGGVMADDMGLGKTIQTIALLLTQKSQDPLRKTNLIVVSVALLHQWAEELSTKVHPSKKLSVYIHHGSTKKNLDSYELSQYDVVLTTYSMLAYEMKQNDAFNKNNSATATPPPACSLLETSWYRIVLDEAHTIRNRDTLAAKCCVKLDAKYRWCLSGTPIQNHIDEFYSLLKFLRIKPYCVWSLFAKDISRPLKSYRADIVEAALKRLRILLASTVFRRTKETRVNNLPIVNLPPKTIRTVSVNLLPEERALYNEQMSSAQSLVDNYFNNDHDLSRYGFLLVSLLRLRQFCCHPWLVKSSSLDNSFRIRDSETVRNACKSLDPLTIERIATLQDFNCSICLDPCLAPVFIIPCGHFTCQECMSMLVGQKYGSSSTSTIIAKCPMCRGNIVQDSLVDATILQAIHGPLNSLKQLELDMNQSFSEQESIKLRWENRIDQMFTKKFGKRASEWKSSSKLNQARQTILDIIDSKRNEKILVYSQFSQYLCLVSHMLKLENIRHVRYDGTMSANQRQKSLHSFNNDKDVLVMLVSLKAGSVGLNLTIANHVILQEPFYNPSIEDQAIDRVHRLGQQKPVTVYRFITKDTIEERIVSVQRKKRQLVKEALDSNENNPLSRLDKEELLYLFGLNS